MPWLIDRPSPVPSGFVVKNGSKIFGSISGNAGTGSGRGIQVEVLDAQVSLTRARFNAVAALADYNGAWPHGRVR